MSNNDGLIRMSKLLELLGNPESQLKVIHIAGTNGKGSTAYMIASVLEEAGYTVGVYTSPHLEEYYERMQLWNGVHNMINPDKFSEYENRVENAAEQIKELGELHVFERLTAIAYMFFADENPDYVVLECGLGGRLDSTNTIAKPLVSVITQVGLDHTAQLGNTIYKIAREKGGIIKPGVPVVSQSTDYNIINILAGLAKENGCEFVAATQHRSKFKKNELGMMGTHQIDNAATAVAAIKAAGIEVSEEAIEEGLKSAVIPGRFEVCTENPYWILDGGHNPDAVNAAIETLNYFTRTNKIKKTLILFGCMKDKNYSRMVQLLCSNARNCDYATVNVDDDRAEDSGVLGECFVSSGRECISYNDVQEAYDEIMSMDYECVLVIGSIYLVGAIRKKLSKEGK